MPDIEHQRFQPRVSCTSSQDRPAAPSYIELQVSSNFSFLEGASHPEELIEQAAMLGYRGIALTDAHSLAGVVRAHIAAQERGFPFFVGARVKLAFDAPITSQPGEQGAITLLIYPQNKKGYAALCTLLTVGKRRAEGGACELRISDFIEQVHDCAVVLVPPGVSHSSVRVTQADDANFLHAAAIIQSVLPRQALLSMALCRNYSHHNQGRERAIRLAADHLMIPLAAVNDVHYHHGDRRALQDVVTCIRHGCTLEQAGYRLFSHAERYLKPPQELHRLFRDTPEALRRPLEIAESLRFSMDELKYTYPQEISPAHCSPQEHLQVLVEEGSRWRYPQGTPQRVSRLLEQELSLIHELEYEKYFLTCYDIVQFARSRGILCQGRGAAANSAVCFCLGITSVDPDKINLLFARFLTKERAEPPDIDIDFEHERREEVIQYIYGKYGRHRAALVAEVVTYRQRSAVREVGKVFGLPAVVIDHLAKSIHRWTRYEIAGSALKEIGFDKFSSLLERVLAISAQLIGTPRHLSQHVGGFVISDSPLHEIVPIRNAAMEERTIIEWDKNDIEELGMLKIDVLGLGMLSCIRKALDAVNHRHHKTFTLANLPQEDPAVYEMICRADTVGVFQIESRAQMSMLPRLRPATFYDLVVEVAIVRPGPIQGKMVHPYLRRRHRLEEPYFPDERIKEVLERTHGVPIFQEQAMKLAIVAANFTPGEAEKLRRAMAAWKSEKGLIDKFQERILQGMFENGYTREFAESCIEQMKGFSEYGFPESHAASFANLVYVSAWLKRHYPLAFTVALLNSQPMGFYAPSQLLHDAEKHGIAIAPIEVGASGWDCSIDEGSTGVRLRLGLRLVKGLSEVEGRAIAECCTLYEPDSIESLWSLLHRTAPTVRRRALEVLADADAFRGLGMNKREALWKINMLPKERAPLDGVVLKEERASLPKATLQREMFSDYAATGLSLKAHPLQFYRQDLKWRGVRTARELRGEGPDFAPPHMWNQRKAFRPLVSVAGLAITRQRPGTAQGTLFITLEDETGYVNLVVRPKVFERYSHILMAHTALLAVGTLERLDEVLYVTVQHLESLDVNVLPESAAGIPSNSYSY